MAECVYEFVNVHLIFGQPSRLFALFACELERVVTPGRLVLKRQQWRRSAQLPTNSVHSVRVWVAGG